MTDQTELGPEPAGGDQWADDAPLSDAELSYRKIPPEVWEAMTIQEQIRAIVADVPQEEWDQIPDDASYQHDYYIYGGGEKRPEPGTPEYELEGQRLAKLNGAPSAAERIHYKDDSPPDVWEAMPIEGKIRKIVASAPAEAGDDFPDDLSERHYRGSDDQDDGA